MPPRALLRSFATVWLVTGATLFFLSLDALLGSLPSGSQPNPHLVLLSGAEAIAALLFVVPRTMRVGAVGLLVTLGIAFLAHAMSGEFLPQLVLFASVVAFVMVHGDLKREQWQHAMSRSGA
jgi:hypothetical protein